MSPVLRMFMGASCIALAPIFVKAIDLGPSLIGFYRCFIGSVALFLFSRVLGSDPPLSKNLTRKKAWIYFLAGTFFALDLFVWHRSVKYIGAGLGTILGNTQVFYLSLFGLLFLGEKLTLRFLLSVPLAFFGIILLVGYQASNGVADETLYQWGVIYGLLTGLAYGCYTFTLTKLERADQTHSPMGKLGVVCAISAVWLGLFSWIDGEWQWPQSSLDWIYLCGLGLLGQVLGWKWIATALRELEIGQAGLILLFQPLCATLLGVLLFNERLSVIQVLGASMTLGAIYLGVTRNKRPLIKRGARPAA